MSSLLAWLEGDVGVQLSNANVTTWKDQSGNAHDAFQPSASQQPALAASSLNGLPVVTFDGPQTLRRPSTPTFTSVIGRRNHFGSKSALGTVVAATMYSLVSPPRPRAPIPSPTSSRCRPARSELPGPSSRPSNSRRGRAAVWVGSKNRPQLYGLSKLRVR